MKHKPKESNSQDRTPAMNAHHRCLTEREDGKAIRFVHKETLWWWKQQNSRKCDSRLRGAHSLDGEGMHMCTLGLGVFMKESQKLRAGWDSKSHLIHLPAPSFWLLWPHLPGVGPNFTDKGTVLDKTFPLDTSCKSLRVLRSTLGLTSCRQIQEFL